MNDTYRRSVSVTPDNAVDIGAKFLSDAIYVSGAGNLVLVFEDDSTLTITGAGANTIWPFAVKRVNATGTSATGIKALKKL